MKIRHQINNQQEASITTEPILAYLNIMDCASFPTNVIRPDSINIEGSKDQVVHFRGRRPQWPERYWY